MSHKHKIQIVIGLKQVLRELKKFNVERIVLAVDADENYKNTVLTEANLFGATVEIAGTVLSIAEDFKIDVPSAVVGFLKNPV